MYPSSCSRSLVPPPPYLTRRPPPASLDPQITFMQVVSYSVYNVLGRLGKSTPVGAARPVPYEQANELFYGFAPGFTRLFRATSRHDCKTEACRPYGKANAWQHLATTWKQSTGEFSFYSDGEQVDLGFQKLQLWDTALGKYVEADYKGAAFSPGLWPLSGSSTVTEADVVIVADPCAGPTAAQSLAAKVAV